MHVNFSADAAIAEKISFDNFLQVDIRIGTVVAVLPFPEARKPAFKLKLDFGSAIGEKWSSAQVTTHYQEETLLGKQLAAVLNFPPRQIGKFMSEVLVLGFADDQQHVVLFSPDQQVPNGSRLH